MVDLSAYDDGSIVSYMTLENLRNNDKPMPVPMFKRYVLPLCVNKVGVLYCVIIGHFVAVTGITFHFSDQQKRHLVSTKIITNLASFRK